MNGNNLNENDNNMNNNNIYTNEETDNLGIENLPGIYSEASDEKNKSSSDLSLDNQDNYLIPNDEVIPYSPEMSEEPINPMQRKQLITENIIKNKKEQNNNEEIFTFKNNTNKTDNFNFYGKDDIIYQNNNQKKLDNINLNPNNQEQNENHIKANVLNFEDVIKRNNEILFNNNEMINEFSLRNNVQQKNFNSKNNLNAKLNQNQKNNSKNTKNLKNNIDIKKNKEIKNNKENNANKNNKNKKKESKSQKKQTNKIKLLDKNKSLDTVEFENFMSNRNKNLLANNNKNKNQIQNMNEKSIKKIPNNKENNKINNSRDNVNYKKKRLINKYFERNPSKNNTEIYSKNSNDENILVSKNFPKKLDIRKEKDFLTSVENINNSSEFKNNNQLSKRGSKNMKRHGGIRDFRRVEDTGVSLDVTADEINNAMKNKNIGKNIQKRFIPVKDNLVNYDNTKFDKYDTQRIRYELMRDYSNLRPNIQNGFLQRMQFDSLKRKNKNEMVNELVEKNKYKMNEPEIKKVFNRLNNDANRRIIEKKQKEILDYESDLKEELDNEKRYNEKEWNKIYQKRFKDYEEYKKKRVEVEVQKKKIQKMIEEEEEINMCNVKKLPENKIKENTQRLYDEAKKRMIIKNKNSKKKNKKDKERDNIYLTTFNDEDDASKYMKNHKSEMYNFNGDFENTNYLYNNNNQNYNFNYNINNNFNGGFEIKPLNNNNTTKATKKKKVPDFNNRYANIKNVARKSNKLISYPINTEINNFNNVSFDNYYGNNVVKYSNFKKNKLLNNFSDNKYSTHNDELSNYNSNTGNYNLNNNNYNKNNMNENGENQQGNIIDNFLYDYCINKYFDKNSVEGLNV